MRRMKINNELFSKTSPPKYPKTFCRHSMFSLEILCILLFFFSNYIFSQEIQRPASQIKKWGYVNSNSFEKFPPQYISRIQRDYDIICITGLLLRGTGQLRFENELMNKITKSKISKDPEKPVIYPMIGISSVKDGITLLSSENSRLKSIESIIKFLNTYNFKGVHIDFEGLPEDYSRPFGAYLKELKTQLSAQNIHLSIAIFPPLDFSDINKDFHNPEHLSPYVDSVVLMAYDYHNPKTDPGCITGEKWAENNIEELKKFLKPEQIWLGIPSYGYEWIKSQKTARVVSSREAQLLKAGNPHQRETLGCTQINRKDGNKESIIYYSDLELREKLLKIAGKHNLIGTALWRLGLEDE